MGEKTTDENKEDDTKERRARCDAEFNVPDYKWENHPKIHEIRMERQAAKYRRY